MKHLCRAVPAALLLLGLILPLLGSGAGAHAAESTIADEAGRTIPAGKPFERIISLYGAHTENIFALQAEERLIGVSRHETFPPGAKKKPAFSYHSGPERFLAADPDLVLIRPMIDRGYRNLVSRLEAAGIVVASLQPRTKEGMLRYWRDLGTLCGRQKQARRLVDAFQRGVDYAASLTRDIKTQKTAYFEAIHKQMKTFAPDSIAMFALKAAGGKNAARDAEPVRGTNIAAFGKERILARGGDIDVYLAQKGPMNQPSIDQIRNEPGFEIIKAVRKSNICIVPEQVVSRPTLRLLLGISEIGRCLYPERFDREAQERLESMVQQAYHLE
jgi:iron complex transport system substrate-binding protein